MKRIQAKLIAIFGCWIKEQFRYALKHSIVHLHYDKGVPVDDLIKGGGMEATEENLMAFWTFLAQNTPDVITKKLHYPNSLSRHCKIVLADNLAKALDYNFQIDLFE